MRGRTEASMRLDLGPGRQGDGVIFKGLGVVKSREESVTLGAELRSIGRKNKGSDHR